nr:Uma2 family endonuclease [uncultured Dorea sp.]
MNIQEMKEKKKEMGYTNEQIAELSGVPLGTVQKIFGGATTSPRYDTLNALEKIFLPEKRENHYTSVLKDGSTAYTVKRQGEYTLEDYYALPDEHRAELIDGVLYDMASPGTLHQMAGGYIYARFLEFVAKNQGKCIPLIAPLDVQLDCDDKTIVEPDVMIVCDREKLYKNRIYGAPDFILEVLSKSTRRRDMVTKLQKYANAGVKEYWMVDIEGRRVFVYIFDEENYPAIYGFDSKVPVYIWGGQCEIDFSEVYNYIRFLIES